MSTAEQAPLRHGRAAKNGSKVPSRSRASRSHPKVAHKAALRTDFWSIACAPVYRPHGLPQACRTDATEHASEVRGIRYSDEAWLDPSPCPKTSPNAWNTEESTPCALSIKIEPDSRGSSPAMTNGRDDDPAMTIHLNTQADLEDAIG